MSEEKARNDRAGIYKIIEKNDPKLVKAFSDKIKQGLNALDRLKDNFAAKKHALAKRLAPPEAPKVIPAATAVEVIDEQPIPSALQDEVFNFPPRTPRTAGEAPKKTFETASSSDASSTDTLFKKKPSSSPVFEKKKPIDDKNKLNKKAKVAKGYEESSASVEYDEDGEILKIRPRRASEKKKSAPPPPVQLSIDHAVITTETVSIKTLSEKIGKSGADIIKKLFLGLGIMKTINDDIDFDTASLIAAEFNVRLEQQIAKTHEERLFAFHDDADDEKSDVGLEARPPIVTIMGHVDHGKTSILDYIRKASVAQGEAGGITQHIGAYTINVPSEYGMRSITFLDTPGHEAFTSMRARGANVTDIVIIVVAADDGIMPQTIEAINHAKAAKVPMIVAINKMDKAGADPDRVLQQLSEHDVLVEEWSGTVPAVRVSAKTGLGIDGLLENILLLAEVSGFKANRKRSAKGTIIEAKLDKGKGPVATVLVQNGTLRVGDFIVAGMAFGRIRAMFDDKGKSLTEALPSTPASILGLQDVPSAGDQIMVVKDEKLSKQVVEERKNREKIAKLQSRKVTLEDVFSKIEEGKFKNLNLIIKADVQGSVEALKPALLRLSNDEVKIHVVHAGVGAITESDVALADTTDAIIIGFNVRPDSNAKNLAERSDVDVNLYKIIYDAIDDVTKAVKGLLAPTFKETYQGKAEVRAIYKIPNVGFIAGCMVKDGKITRNAKARIYRGNDQIIETQVASLKRLRDDAKEVASGMECGIGLDKFDDIKEGDIIEAYILEEIKK